MYHYQVLGKDSYEWYWEVNNKHRLMINDVTNDYQLHWKYATSWTGFILNIWRYSFLPNNYSNYNCFNLF